MSVDARNWLELIKPEGLAKKGGRDPNRKATFVAEPLERGFGLTLSQSLRRVLLSSLQGWAITSVKIENVLHEFSSLAGVREDVTDIVLNLKQVALRMRGDGPALLQLSVTGPAEVTAGDIVLPGDVEIMNPGLVVCHLDAGATLNMELTAKSGKGYVSAEANRPADAPLGLIPLDALYSPVRQVSFKVENTRVGQELDYDKLTLTIETDGTVSPEDALAYAARILQDQLALFVHFDDPAQTRSAPIGMAALPTPSGDAAGDAAQFNRYMLKKVDELELSVRSANCLKNDNIIYLGDLVQKTEAEMLRVPNMGRKLLKEIKEVLLSMGLRLGMELPDWPPEDIESMTRQLQLEVVDVAELATLPPPRAAIGPPRADARRVHGGDRHPAPLPRPKIGQDEQSIGFFFATSRARDAGAPCGFGWDRADQTSFGLAQVHVPKVRAFGKLLRPKKLPFKVPLLSLLLDETEDPKIHFVIERTEVLNVEQWQRAVRHHGSNEALVFVHGFRTSFADGLYRAAQIFWDLQYEGAPVLFSWASAGKVLRYAYDLESALIGGEHFVRLLGQLKASGITRVHVLAHSMGNFLVLNALEDHLREHPNHLIAELIMAAPDIDRDLYLQKVRRLNGAIPGLTAYASSMDWALGLSKTLRADVPRAGDVPTSGPILAPGVDTIDVTAMGDEMFGLGHGAYASQASILNDIGLLIGSGTRPPHRRLAQLRGMPEGAKPALWWRFAG